MSRKRLSPHIALLIAFVTGLLLGLLIGLPIGGRCKLERELLEEIVDTIVKYPEVWNVTGYGCRHWAEWMAREIAEAHNVTDPAEIERIFRAIWFKGWLEGEILEPPS